MSYFFEYIEEGQGSTRRSVAGKMTNVKRSKDSSKKLYRITPQEGGPKRVACGISYSTKILFETVERIVAKDIGEDVIELTKLKKNSCPIEFERERENANDLTFNDDSFDGGLAFSRVYHILKERIHPFLKEFHHVVQDGARVLIAETPMSMAWSAKSLRGRETNARSRTGR